MSVEQHTPGPWFGDGEPSNGVISIYHPTEGDIGFVLYGASIDAECRANARLSAAAPELLEALKHARKFIAKLTTDVSNRVWRSEECSEVDAWKDVDNWRYDGDLASLEALMDEAVNKATGADA